jgi:hypothetical protein
VKKVSKEKSTKMDPLLLLSLYTEISSFTKTESTKFKKEHPNSTEDTL